ncbi:MAG: hypothetical protein ACT4PY_11770 [Armatimonadota bacterium]
MRWSVIIAFASVIVFAHTASAQQAPVTIEADVITYDAVQQVSTAEGNVRAAFGGFRLFADAARADLRTGVLTATGRVRLLDADGRELRGQTLTYNTRTEEGFLEPVEGRFERRVYIRGSRVDVARRIYVMHDATATTCDPQRPIYRIAARRIEVIPGEELVAYDASVFLGGVRLFTIPRLRLSLRPGTPGPRLPSAGYNDTDGFWMDYRFDVRAVGGTGDLYVKYGTLSGPFALLTLSHGFPSFSTRLRLGRTQLTEEPRLFGTRIDLFRYDVAEIGAATKPIRLGALPLSLTASATAGSYAEHSTGVATSRLDAEVTIASDAIVLTPNLTFSAQGAFRVSSYGTGAYRTITSFTAAFNYGLDRYTGVGIGYTHIGVNGLTPLTIDSVNQASAFVLNLSRAVPGRYQIATTLFYNAAVPETGVLAFVGVTLSPSLEIGVFADYNFRLVAFNDLDYTVRWTCDCIDIVVRYRQIRRAISITFGLTGFSERGISFDFLRSGFTQPGVVPVAEQPSIPLLSQP